jgi:phage terminase small subunit
MAVRGQKPKPVAEKILLGNPGKRALTTAVPKPKGGKLQCPEDVTADPVALAKWEHYTTTTTPGHLLPVDAPMLAELCLTWSMLVKARRDLKTTGDLVKTPTGQWVQSPFMPIVNRQRDAFIKLSSCLCIPPSERNRLGVHEGEDDDPVAHFFDA